MIWPFKKQQNRSMELSISDPNLMSRLYPAGAGNYSGVEVTEGTALGLSTVWRACSLIAQTIASCEVDAVRKMQDGTLDKVDSWIDNPGASMGVTAFEFWETTMMHLLLHGNAYLVHIYNGAGQIIGLLPVHPAAVGLEVRNRDKQFRITVDDGSSKVYTPETLTHIPAMSLDGIRGISPLSAARTSLGVSIAGERTAAKMFSSGAMISGMVTPEEDVSPEEAAEIREVIDTRLTGVENAGDIAIINRKLKFTPWTMTSADAQFLESRHFQVEEVARWFGVPPHLLMQTDKQTSWGSGVAEQNRGLSRTVLGPWVRRLQDRVSELLPRGQTLVFDFASLERPNPEQEVELLIKQIQGGMITANDARRVRNLPPAPGGDVLYTPAGSGGSDVGKERDDGQV